MNTSRTGGKFAKMHLRLRVVAILGAVILLHIPDTIAKPRFPLPPWPESTLRIWQFDEPYLAYVTNKTGAALFVDSSVWVESWSGYALNRQGVSVKPVAMPMVTTNQWNVAPQQGAVRFWFKPDWSSGTGPGHFARLAELATPGQKDTIVWWSLYVSKDGGTIYLSGDGADGPADYLTAEIKWQAGEWHMLALSYDGGTTSLHIDEQVVSLGKGTAEVSVMLAGQTSLYIGSDSTGGNTAMGQFDELCTFQKPLTVHSWEWSLAPYYRGMWNHVKLGPVTQAEEDALASLRAERKALRAASLLSGAEPMDGGGILYSMDYGDGIYLLTPVIQNSTNVLLTIGNGKTNESYNLLFTQQLPATFWITAAIGSMGQTNFTVPLTNGIGFFRAEVGNDWDGDGVYNWEDADPSNPSIGRLSITIESPANGTTVY